MPYRPTKKEETKTSKILREELERIGCVVEKMHGNMYQSGQADFLVTRPDGRVIRLENKFTDRLRLTQLQVISMLRPTQKGNLFWLRKKTKAKILVCVANGSNEFAFVHVPPKENAAPVEWLELTEAARYVMEY